MPHPYDKCPEISYVFCFTPQGVREVVLWNPLRDGNCFFDSGGTGALGKHFKGALDLRTRVRSCTVVELPKRVSLFGVSLCCVCYTVFICLFCRSHKP